MSFLLTVCVYSQNTISGVVSYHNDPDRPLEDVVVKIYDESGTFIDSCVTDSTGTYIFTNLDCGTYSLNSYTEQDPGGIDLFDSYLIFFYIIGRTELDPIQYLAADTDADGYVDWADYWSIVIGWLIHGYPFPAGEWIFEDVIIDLSAKDPDGDQGGSSTGDPDGSFQPGTKPIQRINLEYNNEYVTSTGQQIDIPVFYDWPHPLGGMAISIEFPENLIYIEDIESEMQGFNYAVKNGCINLTWQDTEFKDMTFNDKPLFTIKAVTSNHFINESEITFDVNSKTHFIDSKGYKIEEVSLRLPKYKSNGLSIFTGNVYPNPVNSVAHIKYAIEEDSKINIKLLNSSGQLIDELYNCIKPAGIYNYHFNVDNLELESGLYFCVISIENSAKIVETKRLIVAK